MEWNGIEERERAHEDAHIPSKEEVIAFGEKFPGMPALGVPAKIPAELCERFWDFYDNRHRWLTGTPPRLIKWGNELVSWWKNDCHKPASAAVHLTHDDLAKLRRELDDHPANHHGYCFIVTPELEQCQDFKEKLKRFKAAGGEYRWPDGEGIA